MPTRRIEIALLVIRITAAIFLGLWASLKFFRPEWTENIFKGAYNLPIVTADYAFILGILQIGVVLLFAAGAFRFWTYGLMVLMSAAGVIGSISSLANYTQYPKNLMLTSIPTLGALIALFLLRDLDNLLSVSKNSAQRSDKNDN